MSYPVKVIQCADYYFKVEVDGGVVIDMIIKGKSQEDANRKASKEAFTRLMIQKIWTKDEKKVVFERKHAPTNKRTMSKRKERNEDNEEGSQVPF